MNLFLLLIGGNNIANYALIDYFKNNNDFKFNKVVLIYTNQTKEASENIKKVQEDVEFIDINLQNDGRNLQKIQNIIYEKLNSLNPTFIHLNYTGGTKPMSIGAFLAVNNIDCEKRFSDISPNSSKLTFLNGEIYPQKGAISGGVHLDIENLYKLHGIELLSFKKEVSEYYDEELIKILYEYSVKYKKYKEFWEIWDSKEIKTKEWQKTLKDLPIKIEINEDNLIDFQNFVRGRWLEEYIFNVLKDEDFTDIAWNVVGKIKDRDFELDIVITKGHQTYMISCTTATSIGIVKQKSFEANMRAEQIGGIRTKPISVSLVGEENLKKLYNDVNTYIGKSKFDLIGRENLLDTNILKQKLKGIFNAG